MTNYLMQMPQSQQSGAPSSADYCSSAGGQPIPLIGPNHHNYLAAAAALHLNQSNHPAAAYVAAHALPSIGYLYPGGSQLLQAPPNYVFAGTAQPLPVADLMQTAAVGPPIGQLSAGGPLQHNHKGQSYDSVQHFGSIASQVPGRKQKNSIMSKTNLYINGLSESDTDESVRALVEGIIEPKSCKAMMSHGKCRGSGFIDCATESDAEKVIHILRNKQMPDGSRLAVKFAYENEKDDLNVYVRNLPRRSSFTNANLEDLFKEFGQVVSVKLLQSDNQYTGTGFVRFSNPSEAQRAVEKMNMMKLVVGDDDKPVICKLADKGGRRGVHNPPPLSSSVDMIPSMHHGGQQQTGGIDDVQQNGGGSVAQPEGILMDKQQQQYAANMQAMAAAAAAYQSQSAGHPWMHPAAVSQASPDMLAQELQSMSLAAAAQSGGYHPTLLSGLMQAMPSTYGEDSSAAAAAQHTHLLTQIMWSQQSRMMAAPPQPQQANQNNTAVHGQQQHTPAAAATAQLIHWPTAAAQHHLTSNGGGLYYTTAADPQTSSPAYQHLLYPSQTQPAPPQYRGTRISNAGKSPAAVDQSIVGGAAVNGQSPSGGGGGSQCLVNGGGAGASLEMVAGGKM